MPSLLKEQFSSSFKSKLAAAVLMPELRGLKRKLDYTEHGGAPLGLSRLVVKSHGSADGNAIKTLYAKLELQCRTNWWKAYLRKLAGSE